MKELIFSVVCDDLEIWDEIGYPFDTEYVSDKYNTEVEDKNDKLIITYPADVFMNIADLSIISIAVETLGKHIPTFYKKISFKLVMSGTKRTQHASIEKRVKTKFRRIETILNKIDPGPSRTRYLDRRMTADDLKEKDTETDKVNPL